jgi:hypothetical protein
MSQHTKARPTTLDDIDPDLVVARARQTPTLEADALVRPITSSGPPAR